jgi:metallopeptidase MepB
MSLTPPQNPIEWNHSAEDIARLTQQAIDQDRAAQDKVAALDPKDCNFDSVRTVSASVQLYSDLLCRFSYVFEA